MERSNRSVRTLKTVHQTESTAYTSLGMWSRTVSAITEPITVPYLSNLVIMLSLRFVDFWVIEEDMEYVILGLPLLKCLCFDLEQFFQKICDNGEEIDVSAVAADQMNNYEPTLAVARYIGLWYHEGEEDPVSPLESAATNMGKNDPI